MQIETADAATRVEKLITLLIDQATNLGLSIIKAVLIFVIGHFIIKLIRKFLLKVMLKRDVNPTVRGFVGSLIHALLMILLVISVVGALGIQTTSFAALLAAAGLALGTAMSGNLQNLAGGLIVLLFRPYKIGDYIETPTVNGTVKEIQIFHTLLITPENQLTFIPNGPMSSGAVKNYSVLPTRRIEWVFCVDYGEDYEKVRQSIEEILANDSRILKDPAPFIGLHALADSSVNVVVRVFVNSGDFQDVTYDINKTVYRSFNESGISFPFPQLTVHQK